MIVRGWLNSNQVVLLAPGAKGPADLRLLRTHGLQIQEAILTGESVPVEKRSEPVAGDAALGDRFCMAYSGTLVASGQGRGVVVARAGGAGGRIGAGGGRSSFPGTARRSAGTVPSALASAWGIARQKWRVTHS